MIAGALAVLVVAGIALPHRMKWTGVAPVTAALIWGSALALRAAIAIFLAVAFLLFVPQTGAFEAVTHWCWHTGLPIGATRLGIDGHRLGDTAVALPGLVLVASLLSAGVALVRATRAVRALIRRAVGVGPRDSVIVGGGDVVLAAAGIARPRVLVSAGALTTLDDDELAAGLEHERGHIVRCHRFVLLFAEACRGVARLLPGTGRAFSELRFHLERDADHWALRRRHDPYALASAICKASMRRDFAGVALTALGGHGAASRRVDELMASAAPPPTRHKAAVSGLAAALACLAIAVTTLVPAAAAAAAQQLHHVDAVEHCQA